MKSLYSALLVCLLTCSMSARADPTPSTAEKAAALKSLEERAQRGDPKAQRELGFIYLYGKGVQSDIDKGNAWLVKAGGNGDTEAQFWLANIYLQRMSGDQKSAKEHATNAAPWLRKAAELGHAEAQFELAMLYYKGLGVAWDKSAGLAWLTKSAENGFTKAQWFLGDNVYGKAGLAEKQIYWLRQAAGKADTTAIFAKRDLAKALYKNGQIDEALEVYRELSQERSSRTASDAMFTLARHYAGQSGESAGQQAFEWFKKAADLENDQAQFMTGMAYYTGKGTSVDKHLAAEYFRRAATLGLAEAQYSLALLYQDGDGVARDPAQAKDWYRKAAEQGMALAQVNLCLMLLDGDGIKKSPEQIHAWCSKAAEQGDGAAQFTLGSLYESGLGIARDDTLAAQWYGKAAAQNFPEAAKRLATLKRRLDAESAPGKAREPRMIPLPAGQFLMGSPADENGRSWWEPAPRSVKVASFELAEHEVTFDEWDACVADGGCGHKPDDNGWGRGKRPVINVSLADIEQYLAWLNRKTGQRYRLPTDAEWEYAARAGSTTPFHTGACLSTENANYKGYLAMKGCPEGKHREMTLPVKSFAANAWGFHDMHGNVAERTGECWLARDKPKAQPDCGIRAIRGGSWNYSEREARSGYLAPQAAELRYITIGFRLAR
jgi:TPR repeat protein